MSRKKEKHPYNFPTPKELLLNFGIFPTSIFSYASIVYIVMIM